MFIINFKHIFTSLTVFAILATMYSVQTAGAIESPPVHEEDSSVNMATEVGTGVNVDTWEYVFQNRPDPFLPFIQPQIATTSPDADEVELTGMQIFEPGQLTLVAIMFSTGKNIAMVEDVTGKGYLINEGMLIGRYGVVSQISMNQVNITETRSVAGRDVETPVVMRLKKEGDQ